MVTWLVTVDPGRCIGAAVCVGVASERFRLIDGRSGPVSETIEADESVRDAAEMCPMEAILVRAADGAPIAP
ncbi:hypothetical protein Afil01_11580 [Actinorhabdospora filicis]|uniref:Ferredoxin n=1 Tax=Actinorhabdospora filicis TaxID=1785913 RepID=A0A9W6SIT9_9ACTN|nr:ferredoxin [Actinorhabdospora filicis]GLZ76351.1 hypothetical protein Afil01_11580 [Actinorhabdospora filicis]